jgi:hypothetical protein
VHCIFSVVYRFFSLAESLLKNLLSGCSRILFVFLRNLFHGLLCRQGFRAMTRKYLNVVIASNAKQSMKCPLSVKCNHYPLIHLDSRLRGNDTSRQTVKNCHQWSFLNLLAILFLSSPFTANALDIRIGSESYSLLTAIPPAPIQEIMVDTKSQPNRLLIRTDKGYYKVNGGLGGISFTPLTENSYNPDLILSPADMMTGGGVALGTQDLGMAYYSDTTRLLSLPELGLEALPRTLVVKRLEQPAMTFTLPEGSVFADNAPLIVDIRGDGVEEILSVKRSDKQGTSLMLLFPVRSAVRMVATSSLIPLPTWINPVGVGDINADGTDDIMAVSDPALAGWLEVFSIRRGAFYTEGRFYGFTNYIPGTPFRAVQAVADLDGDNYPELIMPRNDRTALSALNIRRGALNMLFEEKLPNAITSNLYAVRLEDDQLMELGFMLADGQLGLLYRQTFVDTPKEPSP